MSAQDITKLVTTTVVEALLHLAIPRPHGEAVSPESFAFMSIGSEVTYDDLADAAAGAILKVLEDGNVILVQLPDEKPAVPSYPFATFGDFLVNSAGEILNDATGRMELPENLQWEAQIRLAAIEKARQLVG
nr:hypothetical protein [Rhodococcus sp. (in: high G+C Gram-positive bacteria)]